ncbi:MAG: S9 family peptidase, partial [Bacteroidetes bacterium]
MTRYLLPIMLLLFGCADKNSQKLTYPDTRRDTTVVDDYFGTQVADPYRWLEDDNSAETADWVKRQNDLTFSYLATLQQRDLIRKRLETLYDYARYSTPFQKAGRYFFYKNDGMQNQSVLYVQDSLNGEPRVLIDPNTLSEDGTVALGGLSMSKDGAYMAYQLAAAGSDWNEIRIKDLRTGNDLDEVIRWVKFSGVSWKGNGFFYSRYDVPEEGKAYSGKNEFHKVYYHQIGTAQQEDELIYWNQDQPLRNYYAWTPHTEDAVVIFESQSTSGVQLYYKADGDADFKQIVSGFDAEYGLLAHQNGKLLAHTNQGAPKYRVVEMDVKNPDPAGWKEIIPQKDEVLEGVQIAGGKLVCSYLKDVASQINVHGMDGTFLRTIELPTKGSAGFSGDRDADVAFYSFTSYTYP